MRSGANKKIEYRGNLSRVTLQQDATQKIAKSLRVHELRDCMYHPRVVITGWVLSQSTQIGVEVQYDSDWLSIDPFKSEITEADIAVEKLELLVQDMQA